MIFVSQSCEGEKCSVCGFPATHKVEETIFHDDPNPIRHPLTAYICHDHFVTLMGYSVKSFHTMTSREETKLDFALDALHRIQAYSERNYTNLGDADQIKAFDVSAIAAICKLSLIELKKEPI